MGNRFKLSVLVLLLTKVGVYFRKSNGSIVGLYIFNLYRVA